MIRSAIISDREVLGPKCANFGCWNYTNHRSGLCSACRSKRHPLMVPYSQALVPWEGPK